MPAGGTEYTWIDVTDFTPGIQSGFTTAGTVEDAKDGGAQILDTWGCVANPNGGLSPALRIVDSGQTGFWGSDALDTGAHPTLPTTIRIHDFITVPGWNVAGIGGAIEERADPTHQARQPDILMWAVEYFYSSGSNLYTRHAWYAWDQMRSAVVKVADELDALGGGSPTNSDQPNSTAFGSATLVPIWSSAGPTPDPLTAGSPFVCWTCAFPESTPPYDWTTLLSIVGDPSLTTQPNNTLGTLWASHGNVSIPTIFRMFFHNGRLCYTAPMYAFLQQGYDYQRFFNSDSIADNLIVYRDINNVQGEDPKQLIQIGTRAVDSIGAVCSGPGNQLFVMQNKQGGAIITGSLESPTVQQFPGVEPVGYFPSKPTVGPMGVIYGTATGVFAWPGGDHSVQLGPQMEGGFWLTAGRHGRDRRYPITPCGSFEYQNPYVYCPNNWLFDTRTSSWFRLCPDETQHPTLGIDLGHFQLGYAGMVYGAQTEVRKTGRNASVAYVRFDPSRPAADWSWRSQPLVRGRNRLLRVREVDLVASGQGTIVVTITGTEGTEETHTFDFSAGYDHPTMKRLMFNADCYDPEIKMVATESTTDACPTVHRISIGFHEAQSTNRG